MTRTRSLKILERIRSCSGKVQIGVYDLRGYRVSCLIDEHMSAGHHTVPWQGRDSSGHAVASGVYFVRLQGEGLDLKQKVLLVK